MLWAGALSVEDTVKQSAKLIFFIIYFNMSVLQNVAGSPHKCKFVILCTKHVYIYNI